MNILDMNLFYALIAGLLFVALFHKPLKKYPTVFYVLAIVIAVVTGAAVWFGWVSKDTSPYAVYKLYNVMRKAVFATVLFLVVMFTGALPNNSSLTRTLKGVRGELAVVATILTWGHNIPYLFAPKYAFVVKAFTGDTSWNKIIALITTVVMMVLLLILSYTSLRSVRRKMSVQKWTAIQRPLSYAFYALLYAHLMLLYLPKYLEKGKHLEEVVVYTLIFAVYLIMRVAKAKKEAK